MRIHWLLNSANFLLSSIIENLNFYGGIHVMEHLKIYRKRMIPDECILLKDDIILEKTDDIIVTKWNT